MTEIQEECNKEKHKDVSCFRFKKTKFTLIYPIFIGLRK